MFILWVLILGSIGVGLRLAAINYIPSGLIPWHILLVSLVGSTAAGVLAAKMDSLGSLQTPILAAIMIGLLGGLTTFSTFAIDTVRFLHGGQYLPAFLNFTLNNCLCIGFCFLGFRLFR